MTSLFDFRFCPDILLKEVRKVVKPPGYFISGPRLELWTSRK
jgi:hypothetical protein